MSRCARIWQIAREAKTALAYAGPEDVADDEGGIDVRDDDPRCYVCGAPKSATDSGCCGQGGELAEALVRTNNSDYQALKAAA